MLRAVGLSTISPSNTSSRPTSDLAGNAGADYHGGYYRVVNNDLITAGVAEKFGCEELRLWRMVTVHDGDAYTRALAHAFAVVYRGYDGEVPVVAQTTKGQTDMATVLAAFAGVAPDGVFFPLFPAEVRSLVGQATKLDAFKGVTMISSAATLTAPLVALSEAGGSTLRAPIRGTARTSAK